MALVRAAATLLPAIRETANMLEAHELPEGECSVKVGGEWFGFAGLDEQGRMVLWGEDASGPAVYPPTEGETFPWRPLIGGVE